MKLIRSLFYNYVSNKKGCAYFWFNHKSKIILIFCIILFVTFYFLIDFSSQSLVAHDEGLYARRSRIIEESNNWFASPFSSPHHKTLGSYWFIALSIRLFGNSELALRLPSIVFSFICLIVTYYISLIIANKTIAIYSVISLSSMPLWIQYSKYSSPDISFVLTILLVILFLLKFVQSKIYFSKYCYIFSSGLFISISFFIRSYMSFVPIIGLSPFIFSHLVKAKNIFRMVFFSGMVIGSFPTVINLYYSYNQFGPSGIISLFDFAKKQAISGYELSNLLNIPLKITYSTFPIGILFLLLIVFAKSTFYSKYPLLVYYFPLISLVILISMSTTYPHYYLFLLPSLSILFSTYLQYNSYRFKLSRKFFNYFLYIFLVTVPLILAVSLLFFKGSLFQLSSRNNVIFCSLFVLLILSYCLSIISYNTNKRFGIYLNNLLLLLAIPQYISLSLFYNFGIMGSPNLSVKSFINDEQVSSIIKNNTIYLYNVDTKLETLLLYYLPTSKVVNSLDYSFKYDYLITSYNNFILLKKTIPNNNLLFKSIKKLDKHILLVNISK